METIVKRDIDVGVAAERLRNIVERTPLKVNHNLSEQYGANVFLKREDLQVVRSYKIRGAYNKIAGLSQQVKNKGVVCASAGNHGQGVAYACKLLGIHGTIFMPVPTPSQKVNQVNRYGGEHVELVLTGDTFDDAYEQAQIYCQRYHKNRW
jgi:threonine dehydratase